MNGKRRFYLLLAIFQIFLILVVVFSVNGIVSLVAAQSTDTSLEYYDTSTAAFLALSAAIAVSSAVIGSGMAIKTVGTAAISLLSEREESFFKAFLIVALCEALAVYGLIIAILLWQKIPSPPTA